MREGLNPRLCKTPIIFEMEFTIQYFGAYDRLLYMESVDADETSLDRGQKR